MKFFLLFYTGLFLSISTFAEESKNITSARKTLESLAKKIERKPKSGNRVLIQDLKSSSESLTAEQQYDIKAMIAYTLLGKSFRTLVAEKAHEKDIKDLSPEDATSLAEADKANLIFIYQIQDAFSNGLELHYQYFVESRGKFKVYSKSKIKLVLTPEDGSLKIQQDLPEYNDAFLKYSIISHGRKVGNGQCWTLAEQARKKVGIERRGSRDWGKKVDIKDVLPGDVMEIDRGGETAHTAVVYSNDRGKIYLIHQNAPPYKDEMAVGVSRATFREKTSKYYFHRPGLPWD